VSLPVGTTDLVVTDGVGEPGSNWWVHRLAIVPQISVSSAKETRVDVDLSVVGRDVTHVPMPVSGLAPTEALHTSTIFRSSLGTSVLLRARSESIPIQDWVDTASWGEGTIETVVMATARGSQRVATVHHGQRVLAPSLGEVSVSKSRRGGAHFEWSPYLNATHYLVKLASYGSHRLMVWEIRLPASGDREKRMFYDIPDLSTLPGDAGMSFDAEVRWSVTAFGLGATECHGVKCAGIVGFAVARRWGVMRSSLNMD
jgi:hypothetical protein